MIDNNENHEEIKSKSQFKREMIALQEHGGGTGEAER